MASGWSCELEEKNKKETKKWYLLSLPIQKQLWQLQEKTARCQRGFDGIKWTTLTGYRAASGGCFRWTLSFPCQCAYMGRILWTVFFPTAPWKQGTGTLSRITVQLFINRLPKETWPLERWQWKILSFSPNCWSKGISIAPTPGWQNRQKGFSPILLYFLEYCLFFQGHCYGNSLISAPRKGEHSVKLLSMCDFFWLLTSLPILW